MSLAYSGKDVSQPLQSIRRALTQADKQKSPYADALRKHAESMTAARELNLDRMVESDMKVTHSHVNALVRLETLLDHNSVPDRNFAHLCFRVAMSEMPPKTLSMEHSG